MALPITTLTGLVNVSIPEVYQKGMSYYEVLTAVVNKVNELIKQSNEYFSEDVQSIMRDILISWKDDGTLDTMIEDAVLEIGDRVYTEQNYIENGESVTESLDKIDVKSYQNQKPQAVSILQFSDMAVGNDWTAVFQHMADEHINILVPKGQYQVTDTILFDSDFKVIGESETESQIIFNNVLNVPMFKARTQGVSPTQFIEFNRVRLTGTLNTGIAIDLTHVDHSDISDCYISGFEYGIKLMMDVALGFDRCHYNTIKYNRISALTAGVWLTGNKPNANQILFNRFSGTENGIFIEIDRGAGKGPVNTITINNNNFYGLVAGIKVQYIISSEITSNRFEGCTTAIHFDTTSSGANATQQNMVMMNNHYDATTAWINSPISGLILEGKNKNNFTGVPYFIGDNLFVNGQMESFSVKSNEILSNIRISGDIDTSVTRNGRVKNITYSPRILANERARIRFKSKDISGMFIINIKMAGNDSMAADRIIAIDKTFMFGLDQTAFVSPKSDTRLIETLLDNDVIVQHTGADWTFDLIVNNTTIRNHSIVMNIEITGSAFVTTEDSELDVITFTTESIS